MCLSLHRKSIYGTRNVMPRKTCQLQLSRKITKFYVRTRFRETIPTVQSVLSSEISRINYRFLTDITIFVIKITILPLFQKLKFVGSYIVNNYNEYLPFKVNLDPETTRRVVEKIKTVEMEKHPKIIKNLIKREIKHLNPKEKITIKEYELYKDWKKFVKNRVKKPKQNGS